MSTNTEAHQRQIITTVHLNAGLSERFIKAIQKEYPTAKIEWEEEGEYGQITLQGITDYERQGFINRLRNIYPAEIITSFEGVTVSPN